MGVFGNMCTVLWLRFFLPWLRFFRAFLSCKANARIKLAKTGHGPHSSTLVCICVIRLLFVLFYVLFVCKCVLPPGDNPTVVIKYISYIISYHIISYHIISYHIISYHIISYHIISYHIISYHIISYLIISYHIIYRIISYIVSYHISYHIISCIISYHIIYHISLSNDFVSADKAVALTLSYIDSLKLCDTVHTTDSLGLVRCLWGLCLT